MRVFVRCESRRLHYSSIASDVPYYVYILRCSDNSFYVGQSKNPDAREQRHNDGLGGHYTASHRPVRLVYSEEAETLTAALRRERELKRWTHARKATLVAGNVQALHDLSRRKVK
jgi:putative endonuclease